MARPLALAVLGVLLVTLMACHARRNDGPPERPRAWSDFVRVVDHGPTTPVVLQTSTRRYRDPRGGMVTLIAMAHVGTADYYRSVGQDTTACRAVLSEMRFEPDAGTPSLLQQQRLWGAVAALAGLVHQDSWERQIADSRWRCADLDWDSVRSFYASIPSDVDARLIDNLERCAQGDCSQHERRLATLIAFTTVFRRSAAEPRIDAAVDAVVHRDREQHMLRVLKDVRRADPRAEIALLIGAVHAWGIEPALRAGGLRLESATWHDVMAFDPDEFRRALSADARASSDAAATHGG